MPIKKAHAIPVVDASTEKQLDIFVDDTEGGASEADLVKIDLKVIKKAVVFATDWTAETIISQLKKGTIDLSPEFQRRDAWDAARKSKFIESILLGLPIPQLVLAENKGEKGTFIVLDGKQRLLTIQQFAGVNTDTPLKLSKLTLRDDLNGRGYEDLKKKPSDLSAFENQPIRTVVIRNWKSPDLLYLIFNRLNSESQPLSPQELRQAVMPGPFLSYADKFTADSVPFMRAFGKNEPDFRMRDVELFVRSIAFQNFSGTYKGNLKQFLDETCIDLNKNWKKQKKRIEEEAFEIEAAIAFAFEIFHKPFRKWEGDQFRAQFNKAIFDVIIYYFANPQVRDAAQGHEAAIVEAFKLLCADQAFVKSVESTTKSKVSTATRFTKWADSLSGILPITINPPVFN